MSVYEKMIREAIAAQKADVEVIKEKRGKSFRLDDVKPYVDVANQMKAEGDQSQAVFDLHIDSINAHFEILSNLTDTVRPRTTHSSSTTRQDLSLKYYMMKNRISVKQWRNSYRGSIRRRRSSGVRS